MDNKFRAECSHCGQAYRLKPEFAGKQVKCKNCGSVFRVTSPDAASPPPIPPQASPSAAGQQDLFAGFGDSTAAPGSDDIFAGLSDAPLAPATLPPAPVGGFRPPTLSAKAPAKKGSSSPSRKANAATSSDDEESEPWNRNVAILIYALGLLIGMSSVPGWGPDFKISSGGYYSLLMFFGMVSFALFEPRYWIPGLVGGAIAGAGSLLLTQITLSNVQSIYNLVLFVIEMLGALPGIGIYLAGRNLQDNISAD